MIVEMDNDSAIKIMKRDSGQEKGTNLLIRECVQLVERWYAVSLTHTCREGNKCTSYVANLGQ